MNWLDTDKAEKEEFEDVLTEMSDLVKSFYGHGKERTKLDRYRDFQEVFNGSDEGKRVLYEIIGWAGLFQPDTPDRGQIDINRVMERVGQKKLLNKILAVLKTEPKISEKGAAQQNRKVT